MNKIGTENLEAQFFTAVTSGDLDKSQQILNTNELSVDTRFSQSRNQTALHIAATFGHDELVKILVDNYHADVNTLDDNNKNPLQVATDYYHMNTVKFLIERNSSSTEYANRYLNTEEVESLFIATESNDRERVRQLISEGVDVNSEDKSRYCRSILEVAAEKGHYELVKLLVDEFGADINHESDLGDNARHLALNNKHDNIANFLLERGLVEPIIESKV